MNQALPASANETFRKSPIGAVASIILALIYGVSPIDLVPDVLFLIGWADDAVVIPVLLLMAWNLWRRRKKRTA